jgi:hypothetical protein
VASLRWARNKFKKDYRFSVNHLRIISHLIPVSFFIMLILIVAIAYMLVTKNPIRFYSTSSIGTISRVPGYKTPADAAQNKPG